MHLEVVQRLSTAWNIFESGINTFKYVAFIVEQAFKKNAITDEKRCNEDIPKLSCFTFLTLTHILRGLRLKRRRLGLSLNDTHLFM
jgi:hypothetical protein